MSISTVERDQTKINVAIQQIEQGRLNVGGTFNLTAGATKTTVKAMNCGENSQAVLTPRTANAAAALSTTYVSAVRNGEFDVTHADDAQIDRTFGFICIG